MKPKLAILDEPDSGIDVVSLKEIVALIQTLKENGSSVLVITHREEIAAASDKASLMCEGTILRSGDPWKSVSFSKTDAYHVTTGYPHQRRLNDDPDNC